MKRIGFFLMATVILGSCLKSNEFPAEPRIEYSGFDMGDTTFLRLHFTDGDGNFGLEDGDSTGVFASCINKYNLFAEYYELQNGSWEHIVIDPCDEPIDSDVPFYYIVPWVKPSGQDQTQEGDIRVAMQVAYLPSEFDTFKFEVTIKDRSMNTSNLIVAGPFVKPG
jgi:hypothetical protein